MPSSIATILGVAGPALTGLGALLQFFEMREASRMGRRQAEIRNHVEWLDEQIEDLRRIPRAPGLKIHGENFDAVLGIMEAGTDQARKETRKKLRQAFEGSERVSAKRDRLGLSAMACVILGTILWALSSFL